MSCSVIIPYYHNHVTVNDSLASLLSQDVKPHEIVLIDDASSPPARETVWGEFLEEIKIIQHAANRGLAATYNSGIKYVTSEIIVFMHPDIVLPTPSELKALLAPFVNEVVLASSHKNARFSDSYWDSLSLYEKSILGAAMHPRSRGFDGKFDAVRNSTFDRVGQFDAHHFRTAGEDGDLVWRLRKIGKIVQTDAQAEHRHSFSSDRALGGVMKKSFQYGSAIGTLIRLHGLNYVLRNAQGLWREAALMLVLVETALRRAVPVSLLIVAYLSADTPRTIYKRDRNIRQSLTIFAVVIVRNMAHSWGVLVGLGRGRQI